MTAVLSVEKLAVRYGPGCDDCPADRNVCPRCHSVLACADVDFDVWPGEVLGIVGESGSGKSTVLAAANLDVTPTAGRVVLNGTDVTGIHGAARRRLRAET